MAYKRGEGGREGRNGGRWKREIEVAGVRSGREGKDGYILQ